MFTVWDSSGVQTPYAPGVIRKRRVEHVDPASPLHRRSDHPSATTEQEASSSKGQSAVKAYQEFSETPQPRQPAIQAKQIMTSPVFTLPPTTPLSEAWQVIKTNRFRHIPILSKAGRLIGMLSDRDVLQATIQMALTSTPGRNRGPATPIEDVMIKNILSAAPETEIRTIARIMFEERIGSMLLVDATEEVVGILTRSDILRTVVNEAPFELWI